MLLESYNCCAVCGNPVQGYCGRVPLYYCRSCYKAHEVEILAGEPWTKFLLNGERQRRKRRNRLMQQNVAISPSFYCTT